MTVWGVFFVGYAMGLLTVWLIDRTVGMYWQGRVRFLQSALKGAEVPRRDGGTPPDSRLM